MSPRNWPETPNPPSLPAMEQRVLERWRDRDVFAKSTERRAGSPLWVFYEGPPTANGMPGTHHVEARVFKDLFPRYRTMKGYDVPRKAGWDCHGLPVELEVERELGLKSKPEIEQFGIEAFNQRCRESVTRYVKAFQDLTERIGYWVDMETAYWTMDPQYVDSVWWALKTMWDHGLVFEDFRVSPYCARCGTALSDAEVALGYETVVDPSVYVRFPLVEMPGVSLLVWTTTPWTLPGNVAVAAGPSVDYVIVESEGHEVVVAASLAPEGSTVIRPIAVSDLVGLHYAPPFDFAYDSSTASSDMHRVVLADFVTEKEGTGLVHMAPAFGADDMEVGRREGLPVVNPVDREGKYTVGPWTGVFVKDADPSIIEALAALGVLAASVPHEHTYPFCWRCKTPLIYYAKPSWYIRTTARRDQLLANNATIDWHPPHIRDGRFGNWLENNVDWAISRDRYWGTPLPFWRCSDCAHVTVVASRAALGELAGQDLSSLDPHRPYIDDITVPCAACGATATRVREVADTWLDSGAMPFAQWGYPALGAEEFERQFPADYICEAIDQTRGWFYTLLAESTLLFDQSPYKTVLCLGHLVDENGQKMSKSIGNILDPWEVIDRHGADALRWVMLAVGSPWGPRRVGHGIVDDAVRGLLLTVWNTHHFFCSYARIDGFDPASPAPAVADRPRGDRWILAELADTVSVVDASLEQFDVATGCRRVQQFVDDLSNWYVRGNRRRFWKGAAEDPEDKAAAYHTLYTCLVTVATLLAPFTPFISDQLWEDLVADGGSVHLADFPVADPAWVDDPLRSTMEVVKRVIEVGRQARADTGLKTRQPLGRALVSVPAAVRDGVRGWLDEVASELNIRRVEVHEAAEDEVVDHTVKPNFKVLGPAFGASAPAVAAALRTADARALMATGSLVVDGSPVTVTPEMYEVVEAPRTGWQVASDGAVMIAIDTTLDESLLVEGASRQLVRVANQERKNLDLAMTDRVAITVSVTPAVDALLDAGGWYDVLAREVLAVSVTRAPVADGVEVDLGTLGVAHFSLARA